tara:strand:+ start:147 stop:452 length:306 start_codon:yes stop_codon:yes gene_type:complete
MKDTGFEFRVLPGPQEPETDMGATMMRHARAISGWPGMVGELVVGVFEDGSASVGLRWDKEASPIPPSLVPSWIAEIIRRDLITAAEAEGVFHENFEWVEG